MAPQVKVTSKPPGLMAQVYYHGQRRELILTSCSLTHTPILCCATPDPKNINVKEKELSKLSRVWWHTLVILALDKSEAGGLL